MSVKIPGRLRHPGARFRNRGAANFILASNKYGAYCIPASATHRPAAKCVMTGNVWEKDTVEFIADHCKGGDVISSGTFFGDFLPALSAATAGHGSVYAFEPNPESFRCASITLLLNDLKNVRLVNAALGDKAATMQLTVRDGSGKALGGASHIAAAAKGRTHASGTVPVNVVTIDESVPETAQVSVLQLDVEGFEEFALAGAFKTIERNRPIIILETVPKAETSAARFLEKLRYHVTGELSENRVLQCR